MGLQYEYLGTGTQRGVSARGARGQEPAGDGGGLALRGHARARFSHLDRAAGEARPEPCAYLSTSAAQRTGAAKSAVGPKQGKRAGLRSEERGFPCKRMPRADKDGAREPKRYDRHQSAASGEVSVRRRPPVPVPPAPPAFPQQSCRENCSAWRRGFGFRGLLSCKEGSVCVFTAGPITKLFAQSLSIL